MIQMGYYSRGIDYRRDAENHGISSYIKVPLNSSLEVGKIYEVSIHVFFPDRYNIDTTIFKNGGIKLTNIPVKNIKDSMLESNNILSYGSTHLNQWKRKSWTIRPLCDLNYLTIGLFRNGNWPNNQYREGRYYYFIDNLEIRETQNSGGSYEYVDCFDQDYFEKTAIAKDSTILLYDQNQYNLSINQKMQIDSIVNSTNIRKNDVLEIEAHADSYGSDNLLLSQKRANQVSEYLNVHHKISPVRLLEIAKGDSLARLEFGSNVKEQSFRKVILRKSQLSVNQGAYRNMVKFAKTEERAVFVKNLKIWLNTVSPKYLNLIFHDDRISKSLNKQMVDLIKLKITNSYTQLNYGLNAFLLDSLIVEDQKYINLESAIQKLTGTQYEISHGNKFNVSDQIKRDHYESNLDYLEYFLQEYGWPLKSEYGERLISVVPLVINHSKDVEQYEKYLPILKQHCLKGEGNWVDYANLYDRFLMLNDKEQIYGTQYKREGNKAVLYKFKSIDGVNQNRELIGLSKLSLDNIIYFKN